MHLIARNANEKHEWVIDFKKLQKVANHVMIETNKYESGRGVYFIKCKN